MCCKDDLHGDGAKIFWNSQPQGPDWVRRIRWRINQRVIITLFIWIQMQYIWLDCPPQGPKLMMVLTFEDWKVEKWDKSSSHWVMDLVNDWFSSTECPFNVLSGRSSQTGLYLHIRSEHRVIKITSARVLPSLSRPAGLWLVSPALSWPLIGQSESRLTNNLSSLSLSPINQHRLELSFNPLD